VSKRRRSFQTMRDLRDANVDVVTIVNTCNQVKHLPVKEFITPDQFAIYEKYGLELDSVMKVAIRSSIKHRSTF
jgi:lipoic acid synthetase